MKLSQEELAQQIGCAQSTVSEATREGRKVYGRYPVDLWADRDSSGRVRGYTVPEDAAFLESESRENPPSSTKSGDSAPSESTSDLDLGVPGLKDLAEEKEETTRTVAEEAGDTTQLVSDETDVEGTARNAGMAYVAGKAIEHDTPGARAFWTIGSALAGGIGGHAVGEGNPWAALIGAAAFGGAGYFAYKHQPRRQEGTTPQRDQRSGQADQKSDELTGRRSRRARTSTVDLSR
jgi:transcriptional regulator with XRE-family HTH domain